MNSVVFLLPFACLCTLSDCPPFLCPPLHDARVGVSTCSLLFFVGFSGSSEARLTFTSRVWGSLGRLPRQAVRAHLGVAARGRVVQARLADRVVVVGVAGLGDARAHLRGQLLLLWLFSELIDWDPKPKHRCLGRYPPARPLTACPPRRGGGATPHRSRRHRSPRAPAWTSAP